MIGAKTLRHYPGLVKQSIAWRRDHLERGELPAGGAQELLDGIAELEALL